MTEKRTAHIGLLWACHIALRQKAMHCFPFGSNINKRQQILETAAESSRKMEVFHCKISTGNDCQKFDVIANDRRYTKRASDENVA